MKVVIAAIFAILCLGSIYLTRDLVSNAVTAPPTGVAIEVNTSQAHDLVKFGVKVKNILEEWYVPIKNLLISDKFQEVAQIRLHFDPNLKGVAYSIWELQTITASADYYRQNPRDIGSLIHELVHIIQQYPLGSKENCPLWLSEGIADWVRYYMYEPTDKPSKPWNNEHRTNGYRVAAYFLDYLNRRWIVKDGKINTKIISWLSTNCRVGKFKDKAFNRILDKTLDELWKEMMAEEIPFSVKVDTSQVPELHNFGMKVKATLEQWYPYFAEILNSPTFQPVDTIKISFVPTLRGAIGYHSLKQKRIVGAADYFKDNNEDMGFWVKSMIHIVQQYQSNTCPPWVKTGISDWAWYWHVEPHHRKHGKPFIGKSYTQGWWVAAYFMNWMNERYHPEGANITYWLNRKCREGAYNNSDFEMWTGKSINEIWQEMMVG